MHAGPCDSSPLSVAVNTAFEAGLVSPVAAGNDGLKDELSLPACASKAVSVGAIYSDPTDLTSYDPCTDPAFPPADTVACFSNR